ncbi:MAG TPA: F0F1 ATP synthase subunit delta [Streptosporangiaceae bacterium]|jgi:F-type H+-transporting ATPase subunit delta
MRGASRPSFEDLRDQLDAALTSAGQAKNVGDGLFAVAGLLDTEHGLRRALSDPGKPAAEKAAIAGQLLHGKITQVTEDLVVSAVEKRWASSADLADAIEELGIESLARQAEYDGTLDDLEDELFRFGRLVVGQPDLRSALTSGAPAPVKEELLSTLLRGKVTPVALNLINQVVLQPRGRSLQAVLDLCAQIAADRKSQLIAVVRVVSDLSARQRTRLAAALSDAYGHKIHLNVLIDPAVVGGISIQIGDELIDSTAAARLAAVRRKLAA